MICPYFSIFVSYLLGWMIPLSGVVLLQATTAEANDLFIRDQTPTNVCPPPVLSRLKRHRIGAGESLESIARQYNLIPATLLGMNPILRQNQMAVGQEIVIPPYNGIVVEIPAGSTLQEIALAYNAQADVIFEINGCQRQPQLVFIPGVNWTPGGPVVPAKAVLSGYPLPAKASVQMGYGWQLHPTVGRVVFHSGVDLIAKIGTPVLSVGEGVVAFVGARRGYGNLVVVNHQSGKQTRYAHLSEITVTVGQNVPSGEILGKVGISGQPDSDEPHLHFEIRYNSELGWVAENPDPYFTVNREQAIGNR
ncbi:M23 family metallopeptidase [Lyngbya sp. PCC 8106]|uniref:peptidoglycan DD-metalloendopeptidase family protein n=1 Tax=Lyngbya sp. (strain PCC 8106) TaxID=313612 RepID=UPI0012E9FB73|nr:M23 family metallopeptidase [Lyngbya sp. PCC 8106]